MRRGAKGEKSGEAHLSEKYVRDLPGGTASTLFSAHHKTKGTKEHMKSLSGTSRGDNEGETKILILILAKGGYTSYLIPMTLRKSLALSLSSRKDWSGRRKKKAESSGSQESQGSSPTVCRNRKSRRRDGSRKRQDTGR